MDSSRDEIPMDDEVMSQTSKANYGVPASALDDYDDAMSGASSFLSDPPLEMDLDCDLDPGMDLDLAFEFHRRMSSSPSPYEESPVRHPISRSLTKVHDVETESFSESESECGEFEDNSDYEQVLSDDDDGYDLVSLSEEPLNKAPLEDFYALKIDSAVSKFEKLPYEVLLRVAALLPSDSDLASLVLTCHTFARQLHPENSTIWKARFLQTYDYPLIEGSFEFRIAYQLRALALPRFGDLGFEKEGNAKILLTILKDMVLETYNKSQAWHSNPHISLNMTAFSDAMKSTWMVHFLSTPLFARDKKHRYGRPHQLFETLQVLFSYLVLNRSAMAFQIGSGREHYDLEKVYNWDQPFALLYTRLTDKKHDTTRPPPSSLFPNLHREILRPMMKFKLDMNTLLHIRNFWHRHLTELKAMGGEETYANMAANLAKFGIRPKGWTQPLQEPTKMQTKWYGHYSCIYPWPKSRKQLEEKESEAELWETIDPLYLDVSADDQANTSWPHIFTDIPAFVTTINTSTEKGTVFLRGLAPFQVLDDIKEPASQHTLSIERNHPYTRLRLRGLVHHIKDQEGIPGWQRVVFVLYKPTYRFLCEVFDHATEWYGEPFQQQLNDILGPAAATMTHAEVEAHYQAHLTTLLRKLKGPVEMTRALIERMEDAYSDPMVLRWNDIDLAYAYEGVITPGGTVMLGRWWRIGEQPFGQGEGQEFVYPETPHDRERGPFVFWSAS